MSTISSTYEQIIAAYQQTNTQNGQSVTGSFTAIMAAAAQSAATEETTPQTLDEYKNEFLKKVDSLPIHPSQSQARHSLTIHDNVFEKMMDDPEYEAEILEQIKGSLAADFSISQPAFCAISFDANGQYNGMSGGSAHMGTFEKESAAAFWRREPASSSRANKWDEMNKLLEEFYERKQAQKKSLLEQYMSTVAGSDYGTSSQKSVAEQYAEFFGG